MYIRTYKNVFGGSVVRIREFDLEVRFILLMAVVREVSFTLPMTSR